VSVRATLDNWAQTNKHHEACKEQHETRKHEVEAGRAAKLSPAMRKSEKKLKDRPRPPPASREIVTDDPNNGFQEFIKIRDEPRDGPTLFSQRLRGTKANEAIIDVEHKNGSVVIRKVRVQPARADTTATRSQPCRLGTPWTGDW
jgi:hypothetical protein